MNGKIVLIIEKENKLERGRIFEWESDLGWENKEKF